MRLYEIESWHPGMLDSLTAAHRNRWTRTDELLRTIAYRVDLLWRQQIVLAGGDEPEAIEILAPGEEPRTPRWVEQMRGLANGGGG